MSSDTNPTEINQLPKEQSQNSNVVPENYQEVSQAIVQAPSYQENVMGSQYPSTGQYVDPTAIKRERVQYLLYRTREGSLLPRDKAPLYAERMFRLRVCLSSLM